jgi:hypothetical protein
MRRQVSVAIGRSVGLVVTAVALLSVAGCSGDSTSNDVLTLSPQPAGAAPHSHLVDGDGTAATAGGFRLEHVALTTSSDRTGRVSFRIVDATGRPLTHYIKDQTQRLHLYVVRKDLTDFRHLHPTMAANGTWSGRIDLTGSGPYRVVTEFIPRSHADLTPVVLGATVDVPGAWTPNPIPNGSTGTDGIVEVAAPESIPTGFDQQIELVVSDGDGGLVNLGTYLGAYAHLTAFDVRTGAFIHAHPLGEPTPGPHGSTLQFHVTVQQPDRYRFFVQVRVDGFLHTIALTVPVHRAAT